MLKVRVSKIPSIDTPKGKTIEWCKKIPGLQVSAYYRKKGTRFAEHYHKGEDESKNPERFLLLSGKIEFTCSALDGSEQTTFTVNAGQEVLIYPEVVHSAVALEDSIFIEYRSTVFNPDNSDTYPINN